MSTSLAEQLKRLAIPQTNLLVDSKKKKSFLFDEKEAANLTRDKFYDIGVTGLRELIGINQCFKKFEDNLFNNASVNLERTVESVESNRKLNKIIQEYLCLLSPYFLIKPAHKTLEWLINRYHIHELNVDDLMMLALPYHETKCFVRVVQLLNLEMSDCKHWKWLLSIQKQGVHLPKSTLVNHCLSDNSFLKFICDFTMKTVQVNQKSNTQTKLSTLITFYCTSCVSVLSRGPIKDDALTVMLPAILHSLSNELLDLKAAGMTIVGQLVSTNQLTDVFNNEIVNILLTDKDAALRRERCLLLVLIYQTQESKPNGISQTVLSTTHWIPSVLNMIGSDGTLVGEFALAMTEAALRVVVTGGVDVGDAQVQAWEFACNVNYDDSTFSKLLIHLDNTYEKLKLPVTTSNSSIIKWLEEMIKIVVDKYPFVFAQEQANKQLKLLQSKWMTKENFIENPLIVKLLKQGDGKVKSKSKVWQQVRLLLFQMSDITKIFRILCDEAPVDDVTLLFLCLYKILSKTDKNCVKSNFFKNNPQLQYMMAQEKSASSNLSDHINQILLALPRADALMIDYDCLIKSAEELHDVATYKNESQFWLFIYKFIMSYFPFEFSGTHVLKLLTLVHSWNDKSKIAKQELLELIIDYCSIARCDREWWDLNCEDEHCQVLVRLFEIIVTNVYREKDVDTNYQPLLSAFYEKCFSNLSNAMVFVTSVCAGNCVENMSPPYTISSILQLLALECVNNMLSDPQHHQLLSVHKFTCYMLTALSCSAIIVRKASLKILDKVIEIQDSLGCEDGLVLLLKKLSTRWEEISMDAKQVSLSLHYLLTPTPVQRKRKNRPEDELNDARKLLFEIITSEAIPLVLAAHVLQLVEFVNSPDIFSQLTKLVDRCVKDSDKLLLEIVLKNFWSRLNEETAGCLLKPEVWSLAVACVSQRQDGAVVFLKSINESVFSSLDPSGKKKLFELMVMSCCTSESPGVVSTLQHAVKKINIDSSLVIDLLKPMKQVVSGNLTARPIKRLGERSRNMNASVNGETATGLNEKLESSEWRCGACVLELLQLKKSQVDNIHQLLPVLFDLLQCCLDQEEQNMFEYVKQLVLGCLLNCFSKLDRVDDKLCNVELIVRCLRVSSNPQTHHHALLLLSYVASIVPNQVMHNMMAIFTFMGSSVARLDDSHSVQVVTQVVETIVPIIVQQKGTKVKDNKIIIASILRVFVDALQDIPEHRRKKLFSQLINTLGPADSFWMLLLLVFENQVYKPEVGVKKSSKDTKSVTHPPGIMFCLQMCCVFDPIVVLESISHIFRYLIKLPVKKMNSAEHQVLPSQRDCGLFDVLKCTPKQLRHFAFIAASFPTYLLSDQQFLEQVNDIEDKTSGQLEQVFKNIIEILLSYMPVVTVQYDCYQNKFWKVMVHQTNDVLDKIVALASTELLVSIILNLLETNTGSLQRKSMDLLNVRLQSRREQFTAEEKELLKSLLPVLSNIITTITPGEENKEVLAVQQTALISVKFLAKLLVHDDPQLFLPILKVLTGLSKTKKIDSHVLASVVLCLAHLVSVLKANSISQFKIFFPTLLKNLSKYSANKQVDFVLLSLIDALLRIVDTLPNFLSPYVCELLTIVCKLSSQCETHVELQKKLTTIMQKIANNVPLRVLLPAVTNCYKQLVNNQDYVYIQYLMKLLSNNLSSVNSESTKYVNELIEFFTLALQFRSDVSSAQQDVISNVEENVILAMLPLVLKLSEVTFKPMYYQLFHWSSEHPDRYITFYRLSYHIAEKLKSLFVLFAGHILQKSAQLLDSVNTCKTDQLYYEDEAKCEMLLEHLFKTLHLIFLFDMTDSVSYSNKDKFDVLLNPLVDQIENMLGGPESLQRRTCDLIQPCISQMALATSDVMWKSLNHQILLKMRSNISQVKLSALEVLVGVATKLGEDYLVLLPETIGSLAELLEDDDEHVESSTQTAVQKLEEVLGQSIREYFK